MLPKQTQITAQVNAKADIIVLCALHAELENTESQKCILADAVSADGVSGSGGRAGFWA